MLQLLLQGTYKRYLTTKLWAIYTDTSTVVFFGLVWCFTSQSTAMVMSQRSVHLPTLFPGQAWLSVIQYSVHILSLVTDNNPPWISGRRRMTVEIISWSIPTKVCDLAKNKLMIPGSAVELATDCATRPGIFIVYHEKYSLKTRILIAQSTYWTLCKLGIFSCLCCLPLLKKNLSGTLSESFCLSWSVSKMFAKVISRRH